MKVLAFISATAAAIVLAACGGSSTTTVVTSAEPSTTTVAEESGWPSYAEDAFMDGCLKGSDDITCRCMVDSLSEKIPYEDLSMPWPALRAKYQSEMLDTFAECGGAVA